MPHSRNALATSRPAPDRQLAVRASTVDVSIIDT